MAYSEDPDTYRRRLESKLSPGRIRSTLAFAALYQLTHELIFKSVLEDTQLFFGKRLIDGGWDRGEEEFKSKVLSRHIVPFKACLDWLVEMEALSADQADRLDDIYLHRNSLSHELSRYIVDPHLDPDVDLFLEALAILHALDRFWIQIEADMGSFGNFAGLNVDEVQSMRIVVLDMCIDAYREGLS